MRGTGISLTPPCTSFNAILLSDILNVNRSQQYLLISGMTYNALYFFPGNIEMWFIVDIMELRGYARDVGSLMLTLAGVGNCVGRLGGGALRYFLRFVELQILKDCKI